MSWTQHIAGAAKLPQTCNRCGAVIVSDEKDRYGAVQADPLPEGSAVYKNDAPVVPGLAGSFEPDGTVALMLPHGSQAATCKAG